MISCFEVPVKVLSAKYKVTSRVVYYDTGGQEAELSYEGQSALYPGSLGSEIAIVQIDRTCGAAKRIVNQEDQCGTGS